MLMLLAMEIIHRCQLCKALFSNFAKTCPKSKQTVDLLQCTTNASMSACYQKMIRQFLATSCATGWLALADCYQKRKAVLTKRLLALLAMDNYDAIQKAGKRIHGTARIPQRSN